ncbi:hypothetical protein [Arthrobacter sp. PM3]|uniref:hypothetical protein n=1 Tax=Arthrobacter sp. PM3 TaxID=2017685 RepID=UPI000E10C687|nr:hypothetical protein [Arthrobacter sp. PM3]AXJ08682.1 hypothetical protein CFN17_02860 [Arthrobacter sp. PM3]
MDTNQTLTYQQIIDRISSDAALHALLTPLLAELRQLRGEISELREVLDSGTGTKYLTIPGGRAVRCLFGDCAAQGPHGEWPAVRIGNLMRFGREDIEAIKELGRPKSPTEHLTSLERRQRNKRLRELFPI